MKKKDSLKNEKIATTIYWSLVILVIWYPSNWLKGMVTGTIIYLLHKAMKDYKKEK